MGWMTMLYKTYENNMHLAGKSENGEIPLSPIAHMIVNAQIEITIDREGNFIHATDDLQKEDAKTIIPVSEQSSGRANVIAAYALEDYLAYLAGDYSRYCENDADGEKAEEKFENYRKGLEAWVKSNNSHPKAQAVYQYIIKKKVFEDLIKSGIISCNDNQKMDDKKVNGRPYEKALVRFRVLESGGDSDAAWEDATLIDSYTGFYLDNMESEEDFCYISGKWDKKAMLHPKGIVQADYGAKLISSNDKANFVFRGRFKTADEAAVISYEATQKAHAALTWLASKQGVMIGREDKRTFICWNPGGKKIPNPLYADDFFSFGEEEEIVVGTEEIYRKKLKQAFAGIEGTLADNDDIVMIGLDAATTGRLSVVYYNELKSSDYLKHLEYWFATCRWSFLSFTPEKHRMDEVKSPKLKQIIECAYGIESDMGFDVNDKVSKTQTQMLLNCMMNQQPVPRDLVHQLVRRASDPQSFQKWYHWESVLSTACALISKYEADKKQGGLKDMVLDKENRDRSYLFGRLLAVAEKVERVTFDSQESRDTNAIRLQSAFVHHPMHTWKSLELALNPYFQKLSPGSREYYRKLISEIIGTLNDSEDIYGLNRTLDDQYLLGYYLQRAEFTNYKDEKKQTEEE